ncbi:hypothetical protein ACET3Z_008699 [Daucus carota]
MQRYHATSSTSAVNNNAIGGRSAKDSSRSEASPVTSNFPLNSRRQIQVTPYKLRCEKESLNSRLGPPDFNPPTLNCPEETLTREYVQSGYRETVEGLEESREISLSQAQAFSRPLVLKCKESIRKYHRAINEARARKRKEGQVYGVPLSGNLLTKPGTFVEQKPCGEDFRKKWMEGLSQPRKQLRSLADHIPHGYKKTTLFEVLIRNNVPILRATWFIKVTYLNQIRPGSSSTPEKTQYTRSEQWTKDVIDYLQHLLDEFVSKSKSLPIVNVRDRASQISSGSMHHKNGKISSTVDSEDPPFQFKWWYVVRILQWHYSEKLLVPSLIIDWILKQLQERESLGILQLLMPILYSVLETVVLSQSYVRKLTGLALRFIREPSPRGSDLVDNSQRAYTVSALVEMLRYLLLAVPDTFVALDCFPLPSCVVSHVVTDGGILTKLSEESRRERDGPMEISCVGRDRGLEVQGQPLSIDCVVSSIQKRATNLARAARPSHPGHNVAKAVQALDRALIKGDVTVAYRFLFEKICDGAVDTRWMTEVSPCLLSSLKWIGTINLSFLCSVFFICEWATCDFRDVRTGPIKGLKFTGGRDFSQIYIALRLLKLTKQSIQSSVRGRSDYISEIDDPVGGTGHLNNFFERRSSRNLSELKRKLKSLEGKRKDLSEVFQSPGPLHDIIVCWVDQHETQNGEGFKRLQLLVIELTRSGIFYPQAYVRQLIVSGIMDDPAADLGRRMRHYKIIKQLPGPYVCDALEEAQAVETELMAEAMHVYSNERRFVLSGLIGNRRSNNGKNNSSRKRKKYLNYGIDNSLLLAADQHTKDSSSSYSSGKNVNSVAHLEDLKVSISMLLQFPSFSSTSVDAGSVDMQGTNKKSVGSVIPMNDSGEGTPGCEECKRVKRQKLNDEKYLPVNSPNQFDDEDMWWVKEGSKSSESNRTDLPVKATKQASRGRQKVVRKTQSLAQLASARIEGSLGASISHLCDSRISCPHHRSGNDVDASKLAGIGLSAGNIVSIGKALKQLRFVEKRVISVWLMATAKKLVEEAEKDVVKVGQYSRQVPAADDRVSSRWKLGEEELSALIYLMDISYDLVPGVRFLLMRLPKVSHIASLHGGRNSFMLPRNVENNVCAIGETFLLSILRRYENMLAATDLIPETLSALINRATVVLASNGRVAGSPSLVYACYLLKKYRNVKSVSEWEKNLKATGDKRLISELESGRSSDGEYGFPLGVPAGVEDVDDFLRQKITGIRASRLGLSMKDIVQRHVDEAYHHYGRESKLNSGGTFKDHPSLEKVDDGHQIAQQTVMGLMECIRQTGGAAQEGDPTLVSSAVSAIVNNIGQVIAKMPELTAGGNSLSSSPSLCFARRTLRIHINCLALLKEALGERQSRVFEIALATEASSAIAQLFAPGKNPRGQFHMSPEAQDFNPNSSNDAINNTKPVLGRAAKSTAAVTALVVGSILQGIATLERMVTVFRLKEGLDVVNYVRSMRSNSNGNSRVGALKVENMIEVSVHWFRVLVGNCRTVSDGFLVELLGEASVLALSRMQRMLPLSLVFQPAYSIFAFIVWRPFILKFNTIAREDPPQLHNSLTLAINDVIRHLPFRDVCLRDTPGFYDIVSADSTDSEFAAMLELSGLHVHSKALAFVPLRSRLFLNTMIDCKLPHVFAQDDRSRVPGHGESKLHYAENEAKILDKLVHVLDTLQPAKFHWQWVELRLLLNEQALVEKLESDTPLAEAIHSLYPDPDKVAASENENNFIEIILTRLLVRPDAAPLYSEVVHLFGRSLEESMLLATKWFLNGPDVLFGRKSIRQRLINIAESRGLSTKAQFWRPWGWCSSNFNLPKSKSEKGKFDVFSFEEGEVVEEGIDSNRNIKVPSKILDVKTNFVYQQHETERALTELVVPCIDQSSDDSRNTFASDLIKQMNTIDQQISAVTRGLSKQPGTVTSGVEASSVKGNTRKGARGGSPGIARRSAVPVETVLPSSSALRASMSLRLQFLLRLLPLVCADRAPSGRNMRYMLAAVILHLLGSRVVYEDLDQSNLTLEMSSKREVELMVDAYSAASVDLSGENLFDRLLSVLHVLLSSCQPSWLKLKSNSKSAIESVRSCTVFDRDVAESMQNDLNNMTLPDIIRWRIQTAMPVLFSSFRCSISCQPPSVSASALAALQPSTLVSGLHPGNINQSQRNLGASARGTTQGAGKNKPSALQQDLGMEMDPWTLLEEGTESGPSSSNTAIMGGSDQVKASSWLKGAVRVRRMDLAYIGSVDEDS